MEEIIGKAFKSNKLTNIVYLPYQEEGGRIRIRVISMDAPKGERPRMLPNRDRMQMATGQRNSYTSSSKSIKEGVAKEYKDEISIKYGWNIEVTPKYFNKILRKNLTLEGNKGIYKKTIINNG